VKKAHQQSTLKTFIRSGSDFLKHVHSSALSESPNLTESPFSQPESNGITEGHVNRLKFLKRQMFGRAHLDLLRVKVLHAV
jgi:hypothetical protein